jgi:hypothetical protein
MRSGLIRAVAGRPRTLAVTDQAPPPDPDKKSEQPRLEAAMAAADAKDASGLKAIPLLIGPMSAACPALGAVLRSSAVRTSLETHDRQSVESSRQQALLKEEAFRSNLCLLAAGVVSGLVLAISAGALRALATLDPQVEKNVTLILGLLILLLGALAAYFAYVARDQGRVARWQTCRGEAESARLDVFSTIASKAAAAGPEAALFGLAVVVRHLLDDQRTWLAASVRRHRASSERTSHIGAFASALAFIGGSGAIIASQTDSHGAVWIVLIGVVGSAVGAFAANREAINRDRANAERYDKTGVAMDAIAARVDDVAATIGGGQPEALQAFTGTITDLLDAENKQWLDGTAQANAALAALDEQLGQLTKVKGADVPAG